VTKRICRAWCRGCTQLACSPLATGTGLAVLLALVLEAGKARGHGSGIMHVLDGAGAFILTLIAAGLLIGTARVVAAASGHHAGPATLPVQAPAQAKPVLVPARRIPAPAELPDAVPSWPLRPARSSYALRPPDPGAAAEGMAAQAGALRDEPAIPVVTAGGTLHETARRES
jgi:hypothetical protein